MNHSDNHPTLSEIIVPGTDDDVRERYSTLASRARVAQFGLLEDDVIVLDTETTGLDFKTCELIEVAAARLRGGEIVDEFDRFVRPASPIPSEIEGLTGITNEMVADADDAATVMGDFIEFVGDAPMIAHNVTFDHHFLKKGAGHDFGEVWIDSLELSRIVLPCLKTHKLTDLSRAFGLYQSTHRAIDDVRALCGLWRVLLVAASDLPAGLAGYLADFYPEVPWTYRPVFAQVAAQSPQAPFSLVDERGRRCARKDTTPREDARDLDEQGQMRFPSAQEVEAEFGRGGVVRRMYADEGFEPRAEQVKMARAVAQAFSSSRHAAIEAGTGVGKSIAYLLPAALLAQRNAITVGVATKSNALADQLVNHELPLLSSAMDKPLSYVVLKGYENYPCLRKVQHLASLGRRTVAGDEARRMPPGMREPDESLLNAIAAIMSFATQSADGDINSLGIQWGRVSRSDLTTSVGECLKRRCPFFPHLCFLHGARRRAAAADVVVTNHSLLFRDMEGDYNVLPPIRYWVIDEAHSTEEEARRQWALHVNSHDVSVALERLGGTASGAVGMLFRSVAGLAGNELMVRCLSQVSAEATRASAAAADFFDRLRGILPAQRRRGGYDTETVWISQQMRTTESFSALAQAGEAFAERLDMLVKFIRAAANSMEEDVSRTDDMEFAARYDELAHVGDSLEQTLGALRLIIEGTDDHNAYSASVNQQRGFESYELTAEPLDVGAMMAQRWYPEVKSVVFSSATIAVGNEFGHFNHEVGLDKLPASSYTDLQLDSSYDFDRNMHVVVAKDIPDPRDPGYLEALERVLVDVHLAMGGSVLTLFTNRREMDQVYAAVEPQLAAHGQQLLCQKSGSNVRNLREHFISERDASLFALRSFWEGFDASGDTLRCVVIPKLPFRPPSDPVSQERDLREEHAWVRYALPEAVITMKQAAGRLIRSSNDRGCLVLADRRLLTKGYGKTFLKALPKREYAAVPCAEIGAELAGWRAKAEG